jgi:hypothetical protein
VAMALRFLTGSGCLDKGSYSFPCSICG